MICLSTFWLYRSSKQVILKVMSQEVNLNSSTTKASVNPSPEIESQQEEKITLWGEIVKGWYWVVFIWKMMGSFGGIASLLSSIKRTVIMLIKRLLIQLQTKQRQ
ncbi:MAG: hypothetical protein DCF19_05905 [Pseudanabaena frigida]|uniref:Uncharacterized protein n=1 Tax=Pseudanabaena frigida TaxID=945775 RepID=A0A2W4WFY2_9CYAN|nr:MAG: hypothetical protein DCF19_05905 [Pseudanabaena frigida]